MVLSQAGISYKVLGHGEDNEGIQSSSCEIMREMGFSFLPLALPRTEKVLEPFPGCKPILYRVDAGRLF